jgi:hypothetical protein
MSATPRNSARSKIDKKVYVVILPTVLIFIHIPLFMCTELRRKGVGAHITYSAHIYPHPLFMHTELRRKGIGAHITYSAHIYPHSPIYAY